MSFKLSSLTLNNFFQEVITRYADNPSLSNVGEEPFTYRELGIRVANIKQNLKNLGVRKGDKIVLLGKSSPNWAIAFMAIMTMGAVAVPIMDEFPEVDINHIIRHSESKGIFIESRFLEKFDLLSIKENKLFKVKLDDLELIHDDKKDIIDWQILFNKAEEMISKFIKHDNNEIKENDLAEILYTSGTTGKSKGVMLTHKNLVSNLFEGPDLLNGVIHEKSVILSILPMAHAFGSTSAFLSIIYCGSSIQYLTKKPTPKILMDAMKKVKPTVIGAVPLIFEKIYHKKVIPAISGNKLFSFLSIIPIGRKFLYKIIGKKIKESFGGNLDCIIIGGASLSYEVETFMMEGGLPYVLGYGMSECSPLITFSSLKKRKKGSVGYAIGGVDIRIIEKDRKTGVGEIIVKGPGVMQGYYKSPEETKKVFTDGFLITGDKGYLDDNGYLYIKGRSKNVIVGSSGENIYPELIEEKFKKNNVVDEVLVYQSDNNGLVARIYPDYNYIEEKLKSDKIDNILEEVRKEINMNLPGFSKINKVIEQTEPFIKTPTNKIKRGEYISDYGK